MVLRLLHVTDARTGFPQGLEVMKWTTVGGEKRGDEDNDWEKQLLHDWIGSLRPNWKRFEYFLQRVRLEAGLFGDATLTIDLINKDHD